MALLLAGFTSGCTGVAGMNAVAVENVPPEEHAKRPELPAFNPVLQRGDVRVTLLTVSRVTAFTKQFVLNNPGDQTRAVPNLEVVYLVEHVGSRSDNHMSFGIPSTAVRVDGKSLGQAATAVPNGGGCTVESYADHPTDTGFTRPPVPASNGAWVVHSYQRGVTTDAGHVTISIGIGFGGVQEFRFENVPLDVPTT